MSSSSDSSPLSTRRGSTSARVSLLRLDLPPSVFAFRFLMTDLLGMISFVKRAPSSVRKRCTSVITSPDPSDATHTSKARRDGELFSPRIFLVLLSGLVGFPSSIAKLRSYTPSIVTSPSTPRHHDPRNQQVDEPTIQRTRANLLLQRPAMLLLPLLLLSLSTLASSSYPFCKVAPR